MSKDTCPYSNKVIALPTKSPWEHPVKCPDCGAIRKLVPGMSLQSQMLPEHNRLIGTSRNRKHWELCDNQWILTDH
jgi:hypothetical protein